jgi:hypothetical protein
MNIVSSKSLVPLMLDFIYVCPNFIGIENMGTWPLKEKINKNNLRKKKGQNHSTPLVIDLKHFFIIAN